jgi:amino acid transporter
MDFSPARAFDEQDLINAVATENTQEPEQIENKRWIKRVQYMVFG